MIHIVTLFGLNYTSRGLAMMQSIQKTSNARIKYTVLAMDDSTFQFLNSLKIDRLTVIHFRDFPDSEFQSLVQVRPFRELCWTAASCLVSHIFRTDKESDFIVYVDSDCYFYSDILEMTTNWDVKSNIFVHEHRYSPSRKSWENSAGRFNVGVVGFRGKSDEAQECLERWRCQVLAMCELNPDKGLCGDQGYLNEWPDLYPGLQIMTGAGEGAAPWNVEPLLARKNKGDVLVDQQKLIFYHFHSLRLGMNKKLQILCTRLAYGYSIPISFRKFVYRPYLRHLRIVNHGLLSAGYAPNEIGVAELSAKEIVFGGVPKQQLIQLLR
jgi:hypothetical protein